MATRRLSTTCTPTAAGCSPTYRAGVEPIALASGSAVRTLQEFLRDRPGEFSQVRALLQHQVADTLPALPDDGLGDVGLVDETSAVKSGTKSPGVQRQYLGCVGKVANGIVTVHLGVCKGRYKTLLDAELFLSRSGLLTRNAARQQASPRT